MTHLELFAGIGAFSEGFRQAGWEFSWVGFSEIYKPAIEIYQKHFPEAVPLGDITKIDCSKLPKIDLITGGFPCQSLSVANPKGKGIDDSEKSGLIWEVFRIAEETQPEWLVIENVRGLLSKSGGRDFARILIELGKLGFHRIEWQIINAADHGVAQRRNRVFIVCSRSESAPRIFPLGEGNKICGETSAETCPKSLCLNAKYRGEADVEIFISASINTKKHGVTSTWIDTYITRTYEHREGTPDGLPYRVDRSRSRCLGNSVVVPVVRAIAERMKG